MRYIVTVSTEFDAHQGLRSPVRAAKGLAPIAAGEKFHVVLRVGVACGEDQLNERGWFVDTDALEVALWECRTFLASDTWTTLFDFRPTFELVTRWVLTHLQAKIDGLYYVELDNVSLGVRTRLTTED